MGMSSMSLMVFCGRESLQSIDNMSRIRILDSSSLIAIKSTVRVDDQCALFKYLESLFLDGSVTFPAEVEAEMRYGDHPDAPGVWACGVHRLYRNRLGAEPQEQYVERVMDVAADMIDPRKHHRDGDPYVLAQALELRAARHEVVVVTEDRKDKSDHCAMTTACARLSLDEMNLLDLLDELRWASEDPSLPH